MGASDVHASVVGKRFGAYVAVRPLAAGGMAELYLAARSAPGGRGLELGAIKRLLPHLSWDPEFVRMFLAEVRIVAGLVHPNIVRVVDYGTGDGGHYFAMEYVHGETLRRVLRDSKRDAPPLDFAVGVVAELADGLHYAHEFVSNDGLVTGLVHRDVSPSNVMIAHAGAVKLLDFGIARISGRTQHTRAGMVKGKVGYMSPEQCRGERIDRRTDVFGLGILLYELSTGRRAFWAENDFAVVGRILCGEVVSPSTILPSYPPALEGIIRRALQVDPDERYATAHEMAEELRALAASLELDLRPHARAGFMRGLFGDAPWPKVDPAFVRAADLPPAKSRTRTRVAAVIGLVAAVGVAGFVAGNLAQTQAAAPTDDAKPVRKASDEPSRDAGDEPLGANGSAAQVRADSIDPASNAAALNRDADPSNATPDRDEDASNTAASAAAPDTSATPTLDPPRADDWTFDPPATAPTSRDDLDRERKRGKRRRAATDPAPSVAASATAPAPDGDRLLPPSWKE